MWSTVKTPWSSWVNTSLNWFCNVHNKNWQRDRNSEIHLNERCICPMEHIYKQISHTTFESILTMRLLFSYVICIYITNVCMYACVYITHVYTVIFTYQVYSSPVCWLWTHGQFDTLYPSRQSRMDLFRRQYECNWDCQDLHPDFHLQLYFQSLGYFHWTTSNFGMCPYLGQGFWHYLDLTKSLFQYKAIMMLYGFP